MRGSPLGRISSTKRLASGSPGSRVTSSPCCPPLASWENVVITYLLSDFLGLWQAMQFWTRTGATSLRKLTGLSAPGASGSTADVASSSARVVPGIAIVSVNVSADARTWEKDRGMTLDSEGGRSKTGRISWCIGSRPDHHVGWVSAAQPTDCHGLRWVALR